MTTNVQWATKLTWPDGHVEYLPHRDRRGAEVRSTAIALDDSTDAAAQVVGRVVNVGEWTPAPFGADWWNQP